MYKATQPCSKDAIGGTKLQGGQEKSGGALARTSARMPGFKVGGRARANSKTRGAASAGAVQQQTSAISCNRFFTRFPSVSGAGSWAVAAPSSATARDRTFREKDGLEYNPMAEVRTSRRILFQKTNKPEVLSLLRGLNGIDQVDIDRLVAHVRRYMGCDVPIEPGGQELMGGRQVIAEVRSVIDFAWPDFPGIA